MEGIIVVFLIYFGWIVVDMKEILKKFLGSRAIKVVKDVKELAELPLNFLYDFIRYAKYASIGYTGADQEQLCYLIIKDYHRIEKGLALPKPRLGFGLPVIKRLELLLLKYIDLYGINHHSRCAIKSVNCYRLFHESVAFDLPAESLAAIENIESLSDYEEVNAGVVMRTRDKIFEFSNGGFSDFARSRCSVRDFTSEKVSAEIIEAAVLLAQTAPSVCNRQAVKVYYFNGEERIKEILNTQNGNAGFGQTCGGVLIVTSDLKAFEGAGERNQAYVDGGLFLMSLLFGLHEKKVGTCALNWSSKIKQDKSLRRLVNLEGSEVIVSLIGVGIPKQEVKIACSPRTCINKVYSYAE